MNQLFFYCSFLLFALSCNVAPLPEKGITTIAVSAKADIAEPPTPKLTIEGNNIWVRNAPISGEVVMKLNHGDECTILEKGEKQFIRGVEDWWYKIEFHDTIGWVFGSQTSVKQIINFQSFDEFIEPFARHYLVNFNFDSLIAAEDALISKYIHAKLTPIFYENPGAYCGPWGSKEYEMSKVGIQCDTEFIQNLKFYKDKFPTEGFCEPSSLPSGVYYGKRTEALPQYYDMINDSCCAQTELPSVFRDAPIMRACILFEEYIAKDVSFVGINGKWYIYLIYNCDCSA